MVSGRPHTARISYVCAVATQLWESPMAKVPGNDLVYPAVPDIPVWVVRLLFAALPYMLH